MTIQRQITTHGFLVRFSDDGQTLQGAQIEEIERLIDDSNSTVLATRLLDPRPVLPGDAETLAMVAGTINTAALADVAAKDAALTQAQTDLTAAQSALAASQSAQAALQAKLDALTGGVINGVPQQVTAFQAKAALLDAGLLPQVESMMAQDSTPALAKLAWSTAQVFNRTSPTVAAMASALGLTDAQIDALFVAGAAITA